jgi:uncharacterized protein with HEPN domain
MNQLEQLERNARLWHIEHAASAIAAFTANQTESEYLRDEVVSSAVERQLITIGEALRRAVDIDPDLIERISDVAPIIGLRNQLVHNYPQIDPTRIWGIIQNNVPQLLREVRSLLDEAGLSPA